MADPMTTSWAMIFSAVLVDAVDDLGQRGNTFIIVDADLGSADAVPFW